MLNVMLSKVRMIEHHDSDPFFNETLDQAELHHCRQTALVSLPRQQSLTSL